MDFSIELIQTQWAKDSKIDLLDLNDTSSHINNLHSKYYEHINTAKRMLRIFEAEKKRLINWRTDYYLNNLPKHFLDEKGWKPNQKLVMKIDLDRILDADELIIDVNLSIGECNDIITYCESIVKSIHNKPFIIKNIIEEKKFMNGGY